MAEPKEIGTVWTLGCDVFIEDALTADVQEIKVNDIVLSANIFTEGLSVEVGSDKVNAMDLDVRISMDGLKTYIIDSQIVPYEDVLKITDFSPEATNEKRYASSANTSKKIIDSVGELEGRVNLTEGDIDALGKRVDDLELKGTGGSGDGFWYLNEQDGKIHTDIGIVVHGDAMVEGDTSSGGEGEDVVVGIQGVRVNGTTHYDDDGDGVVDLGTIESGSGGLTSVSWGDIQGTPPSVSTFDNDVPYVDEDTFNSFSEDVNSAISEVSGDIEDLSTLLSSMWHLDENGNLVTDKQVLIKNSLIVEQDTSSGGEGEDTPSGGISGVKVNGVTYYDDNGDGIVDLGTISGGGGTADLSNYYTKAQSDARYLALSGGTISGDTDALKIVRNTNGYSAITYYNTQNGATTLLGVMGFDSNGEPSAYRASDNVWRTLIHSGNIGSYAFVPKSDNLASNVNADNYLSNGVYLNQTGNGSGNSNFPQSYSIFATFAQSENYLAQLSIGYNSFYFRRKIDTWDEWREVIHSGNIGSYAMRWMGSSMSYIDVNTFSYDAGCYGVSLGSNTPLGSGYGAVLNIPYRIGNNKPDFMGQLFIPNGDEADKSMFYRTSLADTWQPWRRIVSEDDNGNVTLYGTHLYAKNYVFMNSGGEGIYLSTDAISWHNAGNGWVRDLMLFAPSGNVLIGTVTDSGYKLDVNGDVRVQTSATECFTALRLTNPWYGGSGKKNTDIVMESAVGYRGGVIRCTIDAVYGQFDSLSFGAGDNGASSYIPYLTISSAGNVSIAKNLIVSGDVASA